MIFSAETITLNAARAVTLTALLQRDDRIRRPGILILPGGAYAFCSDREAENIAFPYLQAGWHAFVLRYSVNQHKAWPNPLEDYEQTMELMRSRAEQWRLLPERIAVIGFSAGGHLAACAATMAKNRPNAALLGYAALTDQSISLCEPDAPLPTAFVDHRTCPCFLFAARDDTLVPIADSLGFQQALAAHGISFESHIYSHGGHGFADGSGAVNGPDLCPRIPGWMGDSIQWLEELFGHLGQDGLEAPKVSPRFDDDCAPRLSARCTVGYLKTQQAARSVLQPVLEQLDAQARQMLTPRDSYDAVFDAKRLCDLLDIAGVPAEQVQALNAALQQFENVRSD